MSVEDDRGKSPSADPHERRNAALERAWRDGSRETSPPDVDARILAAARAAVAAEGMRDQASTRRSRWQALQRWQPLLAAAAVAGLAFVLVPMTLSPPPPPAQRATTLEDAPRTERPALGQSAGSRKPDAFHETLPPAAPGASEQALESRGTTAPPVSDQPAKRATAAEQAPPAQRVEPAPERAVPPPPPAADRAFEPRAPIEDARTQAPTAATSSDSGSLDELGPEVTPPRSEAAAPAGRASESAAAATPPPQAREKRVDDATTLDVTARAARVERLYRAGDFAAAAQELRAFRAVEAQADDYLPDEVRDWARTVP